METPKREMPAALYGYLIVEKQKEELAVFIEGEAQFIPAGAIRYVPESTVEEERQRARAEVWEECAGEFEEILDQMADEGDKELVREQMQFCRILAARGRVDAGLVIDRHLNSPEK